MLLPRQSLVAAPARSAARAPSGERCVGVCRGYIGVYRVEGSGLLHRVVYSGLGFTGFIGVDRGSKGLKVSRFGMIGTKEGCFVSHR